ncbi:MAG: type II secretion system protein [Gemmatimonadota bacterium]
MTRQRTRAGFSLLEATVAMAIIGIVSVAGLGAVARQGRAALAAEEHILSTAAAELAYADLRIRVWAGDVRPGQDVAIELQARDTLRWSGFTAHGSVGLTDGRGLAAAVVVVQRPGGERRVEGILRLAAAP